MKKQDTTRIYHDPDNIPEEALEEIYKPLKESRIERTNRMIILQTPVIEEKSWIEEKFLDKNQD